MIWVMLALAVLAWPAWQAWRWELARRVYDYPMTPMPTITAQHIAALRKLRFAWNTRIESGGPLVDPLAPYGSADMSRDLGSIIGTRDRLAIARFHREVAAVLIWALDSREIPPAVYRLAHLDNATMQERLRRELAGLPSERVEQLAANLPRLEPDGYFRFTDQHRRLLRKLRFEWPDPQIIGFVAGSGYPVPTVHFKRPFGDMTAFEIDMAAILGLPRPNAGDPLLDRLYWDLWPALQAFVENVAIGDDAPSQQ